MNPVITHTRRRFVWISLATSNGIRLISGSGPRYLAAARSPNATWSPNSSRATTKYGYATRCERYLMMAPSLEGQEVRHDVIDLLRLERLAVVRRHQRVAAGGKR